jgi:nucleoside-diphosphate-sugar epimerase
MKVLVTGASGYLGQHVVARLLARGHRVRALVRPTAALPPWGAAVERFATDLRMNADWSPVFADIDAVIHLAAATSGDEDSMFASTVGATERLLTAMAATNVKRLVLASSLVVYDWTQARGTLDEETPLAARDIHRRGPYDVTKLCQERVVRRMTQAHRFELTVLRPGFIWGRGRAEIAGMGRVWGPVRVLIGPTTRLPLTHVENCADCFAAVLESPASIGEVFNVVDSDDIRVWRYMREYARGTSHRGVSVPSPTPSGSASRTWRGR